MIDLLAKTRELLAAATEGPWGEFKYVGVCENDYGGGFHMSILAGKAGSGAVATAAGRSVEGCHANALLIAAAPTLLAELCDEVERLEAIIRQASK